MVQGQKRILLGQLGAWGDCLYATAVARQIKADDPACHLTWAVGSICRPVLDHNPYIDAVWEVPMASHAHMATAWDAFYHEAVQRIDTGEFDDAFFTQIYPANFKHFDGTVRSSIFRGYPRPITVPVAPVIRLSPQEIDPVRQFAHRHGLVDASGVILLEFRAGSAQTFIDAEFAHKAAMEIVARHPDCRVVLASHRPVDSADPRVIDGSTLSFRQNAELSKYCSLLIGCSSGITWLCTSDWAKPLATIQLLGRNTSVYASLVHDHEHFGLPTDSIIEMTECPTAHLVDCVSAVLEKGFAKARQTYHETLPLRFDFYVDTLDRFTRCGQYRQVFLSLTNVLRRYGPHPALAWALGRLILLRLRSAVLSLSGTTFGRPKAPHLHRKA